MKWGGSGGGVYVDTEARTTLPGLYAAGDALTPGCVNAPGAAVFAGWRAGESEAAGENAGAGGSGWTGGGLQRLGADLPARAPAQAIGRERRSASTVV